MFGKGKKKVQKRSPIFLFFVKGADGFVICMVSVIGG